MKRRELLPTGVMQRELFPSGETRKERAAEHLGVEGTVPLGTSFVLAGEIGKTTVYYATNQFGSSAFESFAKQFLNVVTAPYHDMERFFGITGERVNVYIAELGLSTTGSGGAFHYGCDFASGGDLYLDVTNGLSPLEKALDME